MPDWLGKTIGNVQIEKLLARGGMAEVYLGSHLTLTQPVAIKVLNTYLEENPAVLERFQQVAEAVKGLQHPNIVKVFDFATSDGHPYIVMQYVRGPALAAYLQNMQKRKKRIAPDQAVGILKGLTAALDYAHGQGLIHRDIKPGNILLQAKTDEVALDRPLAEDVEAILTDFGLVDVVHSASRTASGLISGTAAYMSPEQARGDPLDHRTDLYSLGVVLYEMLAGRVPFEADNTVTVLHMQIHTAPPPIPGLPAGVQAVLNRALAKDPNDRYQTGQELAKDFYRSVGVSGQIDTIREPEPVRTAPTEVPRSTELEPSLTPKPRTAPQTQAKSQPRIESEPIPKSKPRIESGSVARRPARGLIWVGVGVLSLACLGLVAVGALRFLPSLLKPAQAAPTVASTTIPATAMSPLPSETTALPSAEGMVQVPAGTYEVGTALFTDENHVAPKKIDLKAFWIDHYQTTNAAYQQYIAATGAPAPQVWPGEENHPVRGVTWDQASAYCTWMKKRLPSEAEWEAAGRGSGATPPLYPWGNDETAGGQAQNLPDEDTYAVGSLAFNKSPFGVFDMVGNVWEWVGAPYADSQPGSTILRGGRYGLPVLDLAYRLAVPLGDTRYVRYAGFRCAADQAQ